MKIQRNNDISPGMVDALIGLVRCYVSARDPEAMPNEGGIVRELHPLLAGFGGISKYLGAAINDAGAPVGVLLGDNVFAPLDGEVEAHATLLFVDSAAEGVTATTATELVADFEAWARERQATQLGIELAPADGLPVPAGFRAATTSYRKKLG